MPETAASDGKRNKEQEEMRIKFGCFRWADDMAEINRKKHPFCGNCKLMTKMTPGVGQTVDKEGK